jgi:hypothetical protein
LTALTWSRVAANTGVGQWIGIGIGERGGIELIEQLGRPFPVFGVRGKGLGEGASELAPTADRGVPDRRVGHLVSGNHWQASFRDNERE